MMIVLAVASVFCAIVPMLFFLLIVWLLDPFDREPAWMVGLTFLWGAAGATAFSLFGNDLMSLLTSAIFGPEYGGHVAVTFGAPLVEEPLKALVLVLVMFSRHFDNATDGFVYGAAAGLGFGATENLMYFVTVASSGDPFGWFMNVLVRTFFSAVMHACATASVGAMLGWARFRGWGAKLVAAPVGFGIAMGMHATWNGLLTAEVITGNVIFHYLDFVLFPLEFLVLVAVFQFALWDERATIRRELADEVQAKLLPLKHASAVGSFWARLRSDWVPPGIPRRQYVRAVTTLALRKHQARNASTASYGFYSDEVVRLRREVRALLALVNSPVSA